MEWPPQEEESPGPGTLSSSGHVLGDDVRQDRCLGSYRETCGNRPGIKNHLRDIMTGMGTQHLKRFASRSPAYKVDFARTNHAFHTRVLPPCVSVGGGFLGFSILSVAVYVWKFFSIYLNRFKINKWFFLYANKNGNKMNKKKHAYKTYYLWDCK